MQRPELNNNNDNIIELKNNILEEGIECGYQLKREIVKKIVIFN
jgi:hypothetical protein